MPELLVHRRKPDTSLASLAQRLEALLANINALEAQHAPTLSSVSAGYRASARNLLHYIAMRQHDLRGLQAELAVLGLSSLGRCESHGLSAVETLLGVVERLDGAAVRRASRAPCDLQAGAALLDAHTQALFGPDPEPRSVRIMVTMPSAAAHDAQLVSKPLEAGMDCMRINCAHDDVHAWRAMIEHLRGAQSATGRHCSILMDLAGPKLRTGPIEQGPAVLKLQPRRDDYGVTVAPALLWLTAIHSPTAAPSARADEVLLVDGRWLQSLQVNESIKFRDLRGKKRTLSIVRRDRGGAWAELRRTSYVTNGTKLKRKTAGRGEAAMAKLHGIAPREGAIRLAAGDTLVLAAGFAKGRGPVLDATGKQLSPAQVACTLPEVFSSVQAGQRVCLDDGKIVCVVESASRDALRLRVRQAPAGGFRLRADKGINLPDTVIRLPALSDKDKADLRFAMQHADMVGLSFVNRVEDVRELIALMKTDVGVAPGIVLKIETQAGLAQLPALLLAAMAHERCGVMIARGDLAVECGYERLAEAQEEILWMCEAAHCPVIWATQVLESLAKDGTPSRAEITDAAMGHRAECVMLNKGPHSARAVSVLDDIFRRMDTHQSKKTAMLRALKLAIEFDPKTGQDLAAAAS